MNSGINVYAQGVGSPLVGEHYAVNTVHRNTVLGSMKAPTVCIGRVAGMLISTATCRLWCLVRSVEGGGIVQSMSLFGSELMAGVSQKAGWYTISMASRLIIGLKTSLLSLAQNIIMSTENVASENWKLKMLAFGNA